MPPDSDVQQEIEQLEQRFAENAQGLVFAHLADAYRRAGEFAKAEGLLLHGLKNHPTYTSAYNVLGRVYLESERYADAHEQFSKVLELDPTNLIALQALGDLAARGGRLEDARSWYERMLQIDPRSKEAQDGMASLEAGAVEEEPAEAPEPELAEDEVAPTEPEAAAETAAIAEESEPGPWPDESAEAVEEAESPWDFSELLGESASPVSAESVEGSEVDEGLPSVSEEAPEAEAAPWGFGAEEAAATEDYAEATEGETALGEGAELESIPVQGASSEDAAAGESGSGEGEFDLDDLDLGIMDDWTPGFDETPPGQETFKTESILEGLGEGLDIDLGGGAFAEDDAEEPEEPDVSPEEPVVTETMAELFVGQGLYDDALKVYRQLADAQPDDKRLQERITELESKVAKPRSAMEDGEEELAELLELTHPDSPEPFAPEPAVFEPEVVETDSAMPEDAEPVAEADAVFSIEDLAPSQAVDTDFEFEDEAPVAGMEQLDPFAVSFDVFAVGSTPSEPAIRDDTGEAVTEEEVAEVLFEEEATEDEVTEAAVEEEVAEVAIEEEIVEAVVEAEVTEPVEEEPLYVSVESIAEDFVADETIADDIVVEAAEGLIVEEEAVIEEEGVVPGEFIVEETVEGKAVVEFADEPDEGAIEVTVEPTGFMAEDEVPIAAFEIDAPDAVAEEILMEAEEEGEEEAVEEVVVEEFPAEAVLASVEDVDDSPADSWALDVDIVGEDVGSELMGEDFGAEVVGDEASDEDLADDEIAADFKASELVADFAPPVPELGSVEEVEEPELTIESYLTGLLAYDPESVAAEAVPEEAEDAGEAPADSDAVGPEDLEQFQNWLRSLKR